MRAQPVSEMSEIMITNLNALMSMGKASARLICPAAIMSLLLGCSVAGGNGQPAGNSGAGSGSGSGSLATTLSCDGYPMSVPVSVNGTFKSYVAVCMLTQQSATVTPNLNVSTSNGNLAGHGRDGLANFPVYARIIGTAADQNTAAALANSVVVSTANGAVSATSNPVISPESLEVDFEAFTAPATNLTFASNGGNMAVDNYNATMQLTPQAGNVSLQTVQGQVTVNDTSGNVSLQAVQGQVTVSDLSGNISATLAGSGWTGTGMTLTTNAGNISVLRPAGYGAAFTAKSDAGNATIDGQSARSTAQMPAIVTAGTGAPIMLETKSGNASVTTQ